MPTGRKLQAPCARFVRSRIVLKLLPSARSAASLAVIAILGVLLAGTAVAQSLTPTFVQGAAFSTGSRILTITVTLTQPVAAGDLLVGWFAQYNAPAQVQVSDNVNGVWTRGPGSLQFLDNAGDIALYYRENSQAAPGGLTITVSVPSIAYLQGTVADYAGVALAGSLEQIASARGQGTAVDTGTTAAVGAGELVFAASVTGGSPMTVTPGSSAGVPYTQRARNSSGSSFEEDITSSAAGAQRGTATLGTATGWYAVCAVFHPTLATTTTSTGSTTTTAIATTTTTTTLAGACNNPTAIPAQGGTFSGTTSGASSQAGSCGSSGSAPERVFQWTPALSGTATIETCGAGTNFDSVLYLRSGVCAGGAEVGCNDDACVNSSGLLRASRITPTVTAGQTYFIIVDGYGGASGTFALKVTPPGGSTTTTTTPTTTTTASTSTTTTASTSTTTTSTSTTTTASTSTTTTSTSTTSSSTTTTTTLMTACRLPATGQTTCWNSSGAVISCAGTGQDGELRKGAPLTYVDNGDGTVTDVNTGLMWEKHSHDGTVHDDHNKYTWANAFAHVATLNRTNFAGHADWRLPNVRELLSIVTYQNLIPTVAPAFDNRCSSGCDVTRCSCTFSGDTWTSTSETASPSKQWFVDFQDAQVGTGLEGGTGPARAVRDTSTGCPLPATGQTTCWNSSGNVISCAGTGQDGELRRGAPLAYADNGNGTVTDLNTGLVWEKVSDDGTVHDKDNTYTWANAFTGHVATLNATSFAGHTDWRLPNVRELQSIVNYQSSNPMVSSAFKTNCAPGCPATGCSCTASGNYWSSTSSVSSPSRAWFVSFRYGNVDAFNSSGSKSVAAFVRAVRGGS